MLRNRGWRRQPRRHLPTTDDVMAIRRDDALELDDLDDDNDDDDDDDDSTSATVKQTSTVAPQQPTLSTSVSLPVLTASGSVSSTRSIPTLTAIAHSPAFPSSTSITSITKTSLSRTALSSEPAMVTTTSRRSSTRTSSESIGTATSSASSRPVTNGVALPDKDGISVKPSASPGGLPPGAKAGIALGVLAFVGLVAALCFLLRRKWRRQRGHRLSIQSEGTASLQTDPRTQSQIMDELMASAYAQQNGAPIPYGYTLGEKRPGQEDDPVTILQPAPVAQPQIRFSIASWLRRHHPLRLNPLSQRGSMFSVVSSRRSNIDSTVPPLPGVPPAYLPKDDVETEREKSVGVASSVMSGGDRYFEVEEQTEAMHLTKTTPMRLQSVWSESSSGSERDTVRTTSTSILSMYGRQSQLQPQSRPDSGLEDGLRASAK
ncbi:hypothetical protein QBC46DRAFT_392537 [Diplogelasinospora grovesii]|uniref:Uncharacterized protein n=1 Tax=Diplogelasinospora grovesii TaxID=303347 RepID=A0AAN6N3F1_9PEZI|nr:hypothetical protein QBC46DRAFT_392537 [Diplogelasinospora grovesii]